VQLPLFAASDASPLEPPPPSRHPWDWLLRRVFAVDVSICPVSGCDGRMRIVDIATEQGDITRVLGASARAPPPPRASRPTTLGQLHLAFG
jgi:hypothetical protein